MCAFIFTLQCCCLDSTPLLLIVRLDGFLFLYNTDSYTTHSLTCDTKIIHLVPDFLGIIVELVRVVEVARYPVVMWVL